VRSTFAERPAIALALAAALLAYAAVALAWAHWWVSGAAAPLAAWLLWRRHPRARFAAYVLLTAVALRGALAGAWEAVVFALAVIALLQAPAARRAWPRLALGSTRAPATRRPPAAPPAPDPPRAPDDRMRGS
jgi:hypothetical protein